MSKGSVFDRVALERFAESLLDGDLSTLSDSQLLDRLNAALQERQAAIQRADPEGPAVPRYSGGAV